MNVEITLTQQGAAAIARLSAFPARLLPAVARGLDTGLEIAVKQTEKNRFTGQGPFPVADKRLGVISGRLRQSIRRSNARVDGDAVRASAGSNVKYFGIHEFGFSGTVAVKAHSRVRFVNSAGKQVSASRVKRSTDATGYAGEVRAHSRRVNVPARMPLRTGIVEQKAVLGQAISAALVAEWNGGQAA